MQLFFSRSLHCDDSIEYNVYVISNMSIESSLTGDQKAVLIGFCKLCSWVGMAASDWSLHRPLKYPTMHEKKKERERSLMQHQQRNIKGQHYVTPGTQTLVSTPTTLKLKNSLDRFIP